jgi:SAM-dependent methyltransferase
MTKFIREFLSEPQLRGIHYDSDELIRVHRDILMAKPMIRGVFEELYRGCHELDEQYLAGSGTRIELGAGSSFLKKINPEIVSTDIKFGAHLDRVLDAQDMDLPNDSVRAFYAIHCFHHLPEPDRFFAELERTLIPGGGCVLVEPYYGPIASWFFKRMFTTESFDKNQSQWNTPSTGVMIGANQALSYLVFVRDREIFEQKYPNLEIIHTDALSNYLRYLFSGGINFRSILPAICIAPLRALERILTPFRKTLALHHVVVLRKRTGRTPNSN